MTKEQLLEKLTYFLNPENGIGATLYFVLRQDGETLIRFADIEENAKQELKERFLEYIKESFIDNEDLHFQNISEADGRDNAVYKYDIEEKPESLNILNDVFSNGNQTKFNFSTDSLTNLQGYLMTIGNEGNKIVLYKKHHSLNLLKRDRFMLIPSNGRFVKIENDALAIDKSFDFMLIDNILIVLKLPILEKFFGFHEVILNQASNAIGLIEETEMIEDIEELKIVAHDITIAKKLMKSKNSPVLAVPIKNVIDFINKHPQLVGKINLNTDKTKISLNTKASRKMFLKLLNDDYLLSELTQLQYDSHAKDKLIENKEES